MIAAFLAPQRALEGIATALNRVLAEQVVALAQLQALTGRVIDVRVTRLGWRVCMCARMCARVLECVRV